MCDYQGYYTEQSGVKICPTVYSALVANIATFKSQILVNALLASEATFWLHNTIAQAI